MTTPGELEEKHHPTAEVWEIPRRVWFILLSWGLGVFLAFGMLSFWIWSNERAQDARDAAALKLQQEQAQTLKVAQERAMCTMLDLFTSGPAPVAGPAGDRGRVILRAMTDYRATLTSCSSPR